MVKCKYKCNYMGEFYEKYFSYEVVILIGCPLECVV